MMASSREVSRERRDWKEETERESRERRESREETVLGYSWGTVVVPLQGL